MEISDILEDSIYQVSNNGDVIIEYKTLIGEFQFNRITNGLSRSFENTAKLENIDLGSRTVSNKLSLGKIASKAGVTGALIIANHGNQASVPAINGIGPETFKFDATEYFESITLDDGWLTIRIQNDLPIELTNIQYSMMNQVSGSVITTNSIASIPSGSVHIDSVQLNNRITIEGKLNAVLQNLDSPGSNGNNILIDTSDVIIVEVSITDLKPYSATAIFPDQILLRDTTNTVVENFNGELTSMVVKEGTIFLEAKSTIEDVIIFEYTVPSATFNGNTLQFIESVPPAPVNGFSTHYAEKSLADYRVNLQGRPGDIGVYNTFYTITNGRIDSSGKLINLSLEDSVFLETGLKNLIASRGYGYLGKDTISSSETEKLDFFKKIRGGNINFSSLDLHLELENYIGAPLNLQINEIKGSSDSNSLALNWNALGTEHILPPATEINPGQKPVPGLLGLSLNKNNSNINDLFNLRPDNVKLDLQAFLNKSLNSPDYSQFVYLDYGINAYLSMNIPLNLSAQGLVFSDSSSFKYSDLDPDGRLRSGNLILIGDNHFPLEARVEILLLDSDKNVLKTMGSADYLEAGIINASGEVTEGTKSQVKYPLDSETISLLKKTKWIVFKAVFNTSSFPDIVKLKAENYLDLTLSGDLKVTSR